LKGETGAKGDMGEDGRRGPRGDKVRQTSLFLSIWAQVVYPEGEQGDPGAPGPQVNTKSVNYYIQKQKVDNMWKSTSRARLGWL
jgi:hypothetical protein